MYTRTGSILTMTMQIYAERKEATIANSGSLLCCQTVNSTLKVKGKQGQAMETPIKSWRRRDSQCSDRQEGVVLGFLESRSKERRWKIFLIHRNEANVLTVGVLSRRQKDVRSKCWTVKQWVLLWSDPSASQRSNSHFSRVQRWLSIGSFTCFNLENPGTP
jgi:hypothetical protein